MPAWLAAPLSISIEKALSAASTGGHGERTHTAGAQAFGDRRPFGVADVLEAGRTDTTPQNGLDWCEESSLGQPEFNRVPAKKKPPDKNRGWGRQCPPGLRLAWLDETAVATSEKWYKEPQTVALRTQEIQNTVPETSADLLEAVILGPP